MPHPVVANDVKKSHFEDNQVRTRSGSSQLRNGVGDFSNI